MTKPATYAVLLLLATSSAACKDDAATAKPAAPATVSNPVAETQLATVTLSPEAEKRLGIQVVNARVETVQRTRTVGGDVISPPGRSATVTAPMAGTVRGNALRPGVRVVAGQTLFTVFPLQDLPADRDQSIEANREASAATAELGAAEQRLARLEPLLKEGATSARSVEDARVQRDLIAARLTAARARIASLGGGTLGQRGEIAMRAPITGVLQEVSAAPGQSVPAGAPLFTVAQAEGLWVRVPLYVGERSDIDFAQPAVIRRLGASAGPAILARRVEGPPSANPAAATTDAYFMPASPDPSQTLGTRVSVELPLRESHKALVIPDAAVLYDLQGGTWVYEATGNHAYVRRRVEIASQFGRKVLVARGVIEGMKVVTDGAAELFGTEFGAGK